MTLDQKQGAQELHERGDVAHVGIISGGTTQQLETLLRPRGVESLRDMPGSSNPVDGGLPFFITFSNRITRASGRSTRYSVIGNIQSLPDFVDAYMQLITAGVNLIVCWTFAMRWSDLIDQERQFVERAILSGALSGATFVYPSYCGPAVDCSGVFPVAAIRRQSPSLVLCPAPPNFPLGTPRVVTWGEWEDFQLAWQSTGVQDRLPPAQLNMLSHTLATWSIAAWLAHVLNMRWKGMPPLDPLWACHSNLIAVDLMPAGTSPQVQHFEPRLINDFA